MAPQELIELRAVRHFRIPHLGPLHLHSTLRRLQIPPAVPAAIAPALAPLIPFPTDEVPLLRLQRLLDDQTHRPTHQLAQRSLAVLHSLEMLQELPQLFPQPLTRCYLTHGGVNSFSAHSEL